MVRTFAYEQLRHHYGFALQIDKKEVVHDVVEEHAKGEVDAFVSHVMQWIKRGLAKKDAFIQDMPGLVEC